MALVNDRKPLSITALLTGRERICVVEYHYKPKLQLGRTWEMMGGIEYEQASLHKRGLRWRQWR